MSAYVMYGFDTAGTLAEETNDPRRAAPPAIIRALVGGGVPDRRPADPVRRSWTSRTSTTRTSACSGLPYIDQAGARQHDRQRLPGRLGDRDHVCCLAVETATHPDAVLDGARRASCRAGSAVARVSGRRKVPIIPALVTGILAILVAWRSTSPTRARSPRSRRSRSSCSTSATSASPCRCCCRALPRARGRRPTTGRTSRWAAGACRSTSSRSSSGCAS